MDVYVTITLKIFFICFEHMANSFKTILYHVIKAYKLCLRGVYVLNEEEMIKFSIIYVQ